MKPLVIKRTIDMNERIKELALRAGLTWRVQPPHYTNTNSPIDFPVSANRDLEKFAELIVRECIKVCAEKETAFQNESLSAQSQVGRDAWRDKRDGAGECVFGIKEHFGVEE
jgi:hypothetical protein